MGREIRARAMSHCYWHPTRSQMILPLFPREYERKHLQDGDVAEVILLAFPKERPRDGFGHHQLSGSVSIQLKNFLPKMSVKSDAEVDWELKYETLRGKINAAERQLTRYAGISLFLCVLWYIFGYLLLPEDGRMWAIVLTVFVALWLAWQATAMDIYIEILRKEETQ